MLINLFAEETQLQRLSELGDSLENRISFQRFIGLSLGERVPDAKTIWLFKDTNTLKEIIEPLFYQFTAQLESQGIITHTGTFVDATFVAAPRQRNTHEENNQIKNGETSME